MLYISILIWSCICADICFGFHWSAFKFGSSILNRRNTLLFARPEIGEAVSAKLDALVGPPNNQVAALSIRQEDEFYSATMPTSTLTPEVKKRLKVGMTLDVVVTNNIGSDLEVLLCEDTQAIDFLTHRLNDTSIDDDRDPVEILRDEYDKLCRSKNTLNIFEFWTWDNLKIAIDSGALTKKEIETILKDVGVTKDSVIEFSTFLIINQKIDSEIRAKLQEYKDSLERYKDDDDGSLEASDRAKFVYKKNNEGSVEESQLDDEDNEEDTFASEEEYVEALRSAYKGLSRDNVVYVSDFLQFPEIQELLTDGSITQEDMLSYLATVKSTIDGTLTFDQFMHLTVLVRKNLMSSEQEAPDQMSYAESDMDMNADADVDGDADGASEESIRHAEELEAEQYDQNSFNEMADENGLLSVSNYVAWCEKEDLFSPEDISLDGLYKIIALTNVSPSGFINCQQFIDLNKIIDYMMIEAESDTIEEGDFENNNDEIGDIEKPPNNTEETLEDIFKRLSKGSEQLKVSTFFKWCDSEGFFSYSLLNRKGVHLLLKLMNVKPTETITYEQFNRLEDAIVYILFGDEEQDAEDDRNEQHSDSVEGMNSNNDEDEYEGG